MVVVDLFAGCGGMSLGFEWAGAGVVFANEIDAWAAETYSKNRDGVFVIQSDIRDLVDFTPFVKLPIDIVVGGPPCQGFSLSGKRDPKDPRNSLFMEYLRVIDAVKPRYFVMENVKGLLSMRTANKQFVRDIVVAEAEAVGYRVVYNIINACDFGVPQSRERVFFVGVRGDLPFDPARLHPTPLVHRHVTLEEAISDLPRIEAGGGAEEMSYAIEPQNEYQSWARGGLKSVSNHVAMRHTKRLISRFKSIAYGQSLKDVSDEHRAVKRGNPKDKNGVVYAQNNMKPFPHLPCPTIAASFQSNFVHPFVDRNFTAREGARIQSFPDWYRFYGKRTTMSWEKNLSQYQQIGNAVPPLLAKAVAENLACYEEGVARGAVETTLKEKPITSQIDLRL